VQVECAKSQPMGDKLSLIGAWSGHATHYKILVLNHITGAAVPKVVKFCTQIRYINSNNRMTYHIQKGAWS